MIWSGLPPIWGQLQAADVRFAQYLQTPTSGYLEREWSQYSFCLVCLLFLFFLCRLPDICYKEGDIWNQSQYLLLASWRVRSFLLIGIMTYTPERLDGKEMKVLNLGRLYHWQPFFLCAQNILKISRVSSGKPISSRIHSICRALPVQYFPKKLENILQIHFNLSHNSLRKLAQADLYKPQFCTLAIFIKNVTKAQRTQDIES